MVDDPAVPPGDTLPGDSPPAAAPRPRIRLRTPLVIVAACGAIAAVLWVFFEHRPAERFISSISMFNSAAIGLWIWAVFFTGRPRRTKWGLVALTACGLLLSVAVLRVEGFSGNMVPHLVWRWTPRPSDSIGAAPRPTEVAPDVVDLVTTGPDDYPQFLGPQRRPEVLGVMLGRDWSANPPREIWRRPIGEGWSAFAIVNGFAVTQEQRGELELVTCYELATGEPRWAHSDRARFSSVLGDDGPRSTPTISGGRVYTLGATGILNCLDGATGEKHWGRNIHADTQSINLQWGRSCSPLVVDDTIVVGAAGTNGEPRGKSLVAYDAKTGAIRWSAGDEPSSFSSPALATIAGVRQILIVGGIGVTAHDPAAAGAILWRVDWYNPQPNVSQPVVLSGDRVLLSSGYGMGCVLLQVTRDEAGRFHTAELWRNKNLKAKFTNVVVRDEHVYGLDEGILACLDLETGDRAWRNGRYGHGQVLLVDDLILVLAEDGRLALVEATPDEYRELASIQALEGKTWNNPALSGRYLLIRNDREAVCYELPEG